MEESLTERAINGKIIMTKTKAQKFSVERAGC
jgi:hypothetical protein